MSPFLLRIARFGQFPVVGVPMHMSFQVVGDALISQQNHVFLAVALLQSPPFWMQMKHAAFPYAGASSDVLVLIRGKKQKRIVRRMD